MGYKLTAIHHHFFHQKIWIKPIFLLLVVFGSLSMAEYAAGQVYRGHVLDEATRQPVPYVIVMLQNTKGEYVRHDNTDENGFFEIKAPEVKEYLVHVNRIGYTENTGGPFRVEKDDTLNIEMRVLEKTENLGEVTVEAKAYQEKFNMRYLEENSFFVRKKRSLGQFMTKEDIEKVHAIEPSDLFRRFLGFSTNRGVIMNQARGCRPKVIINGMIMSEPSSLTIVKGDVFTPTFTIDRLVALENIIGIEAYTGMVGQPLEFGTPSRCGAVLVWTR